jgi:hypothetical protein
LAEIPSAIEAFEALRTIHAWNHLETAFVADPSSISAASLRVSQGVATDIYLTRIGDRPTGHRIWVEDSYRRLALRGFRPGDPISVTPRAGRGLLVKAVQEPTGRSVARRKSAPLLSLEGPWVSSAIDGDMVRVRLGYRSAVIIPRVYAFHVKRHGLTVSIDGSQVIVNGQNVTLNTERPLRLSEPVSRVAFAAQWSNLIVGTEFIATHGPAEVYLTGAEASLASSFLLDAGYRQETPNLFTK